MRLDDFHHQAHHRTWREEFAAALALAHRKVAQKVFVNLTEDIARGIQRDVIEVPQQFLGDQPLFFIALTFVAAVETVVLLLRQHTLKLRLAQFDAGHCGTDGLGDVFFLGQVQQVVVARGRAECEAAFLDGDILQAALAACAFELAVLGQDGLFVLAVFVVGKLEKDQAQNRRAVFAGLEIGIGAQLVRSGPEVALEFFELVAGHWLRYDACRGGRALHAALVKAA